MIQEKELTLRDLLLRGLAYYVMLENAVKYGGIPNDKTVMNKIHGILKGKADFDYNKLGNIKIKHLIRND